MIKRTLSVLCLAVILVGCEPATQQTASGVTTDILDQMVIDGQFADAIVAGEEFIAKYPDNDQAHLMLGWAYTKDNQLDKGEARFREALRLNPNKDNAYVGLGVISRKNGDNAQARKHHLQAINIYPDNAEALSSLLVIEMMEGNTQDALDYGERAWALEQASPVIAANLCIAYHFAGKKADRDTFYDHAKRLGYYNMPAIDEIIAEQ